MIQCKRKPQYKQVTSKLKLSRVTVANYKQSETMTCYGFKLETSLKVVSMLRLQLASYKQAAAVTCHGCKLHATWSSKEAEAVTTAA